MKLSPWSLAVAISGGAIGGALLRVVAQRAFNTSVFSPYGTLIINLLGSFLMGALASYFRQRGYSLVFYGLTAGFCGSLTTFSSISLEALDMMRLHQAARAGLYLLGTVLGGLVAVGVGWLVGHELAKWILSFPDKAQSGSLPL